MIQLEIGWPLLVRARVFLTLSKKSKEIEVLREGAQQRDKKEFGGFRILLEILHALKLQGRLFQRHLKTVSRVLML